MKKKVLLITFGIMLGLTACAGQPAQAPAEESAGNTEQAAEAGNGEAAKEDTPAQASKEETTEPSTEETGYVEDAVLSTDLISITVPDEFKGSFLATVEDDTISIYDKECNESGYGGYVFSLCVDKDRVLVPGGMYTKVGEVTSPDGEVYDVCRGYASEVQWDYNKYEDMPESYKKLYDASDSIIETAQGAGGATFRLGAGMKGEELYADVISKYKTAFAEGWDAAKFEEEGMSPEFGALLQNEGDKAHDLIGYAYRDISSDGVDELLVGEISDTDEASVVYDVYTVVNREPKLIVSGSSRNRYYVLSYGGLVNEYSGGANESGVTTYQIDSGTGELMHQFTLKYDGYTDEKNPWFVSYDSPDDGFEAMTEEEYDSRTEGLTEEYMKLDLKKF